MRQKAVPIIGQYFFISMPALPRLYPLDAMRAPQRPVKRLYLGKDETRPGRQERRSGPRRMLHGSGSSKEEMDTIPL